MRNVGIPERDRHDTPAPGRKVKMGEKGFIIIIITKCTECSCAERKISIFESLCSSEEVLGQVGTLNNKVH